MRGGTVNADPLPVELLASDDARRLETALAAPRPITVADHQRFRESLTPKPPADPIDELVGELREIEADREAASQ